MKITTDGQRLYNVQDLEARFPKRIADRIWADVEVGTPTGEFITVGGQLIYDDADIPMPWSGLCEEADFLDLCSRCSKAMAEGVLPEK